MERDKIQESIDQNTYETVGLLKLIRGDIKHYAKQLAQILMMILVATVIGILF